MRVLEGILYHHALINSSLGAAVLGENVFWIAELFFKAAAANLFFLEIHV